MRVLAWNILRGGRARTAQIVEAICTHAPEVIVLSEYQAAGSTSIIEALQGNGWPHFIGTTQQKRQGGLAVLSSSLLEARPRPAGLKGFERHYLGVSLPESGLEVRAIYGPLDRMTHGQYWTELLKVLQAESANEVLVVGDFNSGSPNFDAPIAGVFSGKFFDQLPAMGFTDLWRAKSGVDAREHTWQGSKNPYRLDHAFGSASLASRVRACAYSHDERTAAISDHSILLVDIG